MNFGAKILIVGWLFLLVLSPLALMARVGVGVGTGSIKVSEPLKAGKSYTLPSLVVLNTGDEPSEYGVRIAHRENQPEMKPDEAWFLFEPSSFHLEPGESQLVSVSLDLPVRGALPGEYFSFLQARPLTVVQTAGQTSVGVAAASQLRFTVKPSNVIQALYYKFSDWYVHYHPWNTVILVIIFVVVLVGLLGRRFKFQIARK